MQKRDIKFDKEWPRGYNQGRRKRNMILQFSVKNHRSIKDKAIISLKASSDRTFSENLILPDGKKRLLPVMAVYGANAAGKSNLIHSILLMKEMVCGKYAKLLKGENLPQEPFEFSDTNEPTEMEIIFFYKGIKYAYGFSFTKEKIEREYLYHWPNGREALVFSRNESEFQFRENVQEQIILAKRTTKNRLYLTTSNEWNCAATENAYMWFKNRIEGITADSDKITIDAIRRSGESKAKILEELRYADLGINDIILPADDNDEIKIIHEINDKRYSLLLKQESKGTQRFFSRIGSWINAIDNGSVIIVDGIEASMHPLLTRHLIEMIQDSEINEKGAQLIFTTHDTEFLDLNLLRRDQVWFAERNQNDMDTEIYALTDFSPRKGENVAKGYMQGRYGAIPFIK